MTRRTTLLPWQAERIPNLLRDHNLAPGHYYLSRGHGVICYGFLIECCM